MTSLKWCARKGRLLLPTAVLIAGVYYLLEGMLRTGSLDRPPLTAALSENAPKTRVGSRYVTLPDYLPAENVYSGDSTVTLATQGTAEFLHHVEILCRRWTGPVSVAVYAPGDDFRTAVRSIARLRSCGPPCLSANVSWHLFFDRKHAPSDRELIEARNRTENCKAAPYRSAGPGYRHGRNLTYPINMARNLARRMSATRYVLASDIELYPSLELVPRFLRMIGRRSDSPRSVYVLPVFEVDTRATVPDDKRQLLDLFSRRRAVFFHKYVCDVCHRFPHRDRWLKFLPPPESLDVFVSTKRPRSWEPFYLGTNDEPTFDERFTWEGKMNKMPQVLEMCFMDYDFLILDNAFLVHSPGIKRIRPSSEHRRAPYAAVNRKIFYKHRFHLAVKYGPKRHCW